MKDSSIIQIKKVKKVPFEQIRVIRDEDRIHDMFPAYLNDESKITEGNAKLLFFPRSEAEVAAVVKEMAIHNIPITISGARTGIVGGSVPYGGSVLSLERMSKVLGISYDYAEEEWSVRCEAGVTLKDLNHMLELKKFPDLEKSDDIIIKEFLKKFKLETLPYYYPLDPTEMTAAIGGTVATNASGARTYKYGATREWVRSIRVVLPEGAIISIPRGRYRASKDNTFSIKGKSRTVTFKIPSYIMPRGKHAAGLFTEPNMDLIDLFIGSEGVLGVITEVEIRIAVKPNVVSTLSFFTEPKDAISFVKEIKDPINAIDVEFLEAFFTNSLALLRQKQKNEPKSLDIPKLPEDKEVGVFYDLSFPRSDPKSFDHLDIVREDLEVLREKLKPLLKRSNGSLEETWAVYENRDLERFKIFRHAVPETVNTIIAERKRKYPKLHKLGTDLSVPEEHFQELMDFYSDKLSDAGIEWVAFGHIGDNHVHVNMLPNNDEDLIKAKELYVEFARYAVKLGGTVSAEHGIGKIKLQMLEILYGKEGIDQMLEVKRVLDPKFLFNRGNVIST